MVIQIPTNIIGISSGDLVQGILRSLPLRSLIYNGPPPEIPQYIGTHMITSSSIMLRSFMFKYMKFPRLFRWIPKYLLYIYRNVKQYI